MLIGSIYGWESGRDTLFDPSSPRNRDNCLEPFRVMRSYALKRGIELHTADVIDKCNLRPDFGLHIESDLANLGRTSLDYLIRFETPLTVPLNADINFLRNFKGIFTWDLDLIDGKGHNAGYKSIPKDRLIEFRVPNPFPLTVAIEKKPASYYERDIFCCLIASNRHANLYDRRALYSERVKAIRWFEKNALLQFKLYGHGWQSPEKRLGVIGKLRYRLEKIPPFLARKPVFPSYQGPIEYKQSVLTKSKFSICFENARDIRGYLTEKIFDCLFAGCVPIYWGEPDIAGWIPEACFIDFRKFRSYDSLYEYICKLTPEEYEEIQNAGQNFLLSKEFSLHSSKEFSRVVIDRIAADFGLRLL